MRLDTYRAINPLCSQITDFPCIPRATRHSQSRVKLLQVVILHLLCPSTCQQFSPQPKKPQSLSWLEDNTQGLSRCAALICNCRCTLWKKQHQVSSFALSALRNRKVHRGRWISEKQKMSWEFLARVESAGVSSSFQDLSQHRQCTSDCKQCELGEMRLYRWQMQPQTVPCQPREQGKCLSTQPAGKYSFPKYYKNLS